MSRKCYPLAFTLLLFATTAFAQVSPTRQFDYPHRMLPDPEGSYDPTIPTPEQTLGFKVASRPAFPDEILAVFKAMADASPKAELFEYARSYEDRPLVYMAISSAANIARLDEIKQNLAKLADPRGLDEAEAERILKDTPATAWLAYSIHGDETSGSDASMLVAYHLIASQSQETASWLDHMVILIDPVQNPDGRQRALNQVTQHSGNAPNVDNQSLLHTGYWPWGRMNHYLFDLNRDWTLGVNPESRGRIVEARAWHPLLFVDAHEMGAQDTYLFTPDTEPLNDNFPAYLEEWQQSFGRDQAATFDNRGWTYYNGEWADDWYPGYGDAWGRLNGAVGILYEQAGLSKDGIRRPEGTVITYAEAVHHQAVSSWTNLRSLFKGADELQRGFLRDRRSMVSKSGPYANRSWVILPTTDTTRLRGFLDKLDLQGIEYSTADAAFTAGAGRDELGQAFRSKEIPAGSILISNRQPTARVAAAILEFDPRLSEKILKKERGEILKHGSGVMYDVTAWSLPMFYGLDALELDQDIPSRGLSPGHKERSDPAAPTVSKVGYVVDGTDDASVAFAARLMERGVWVRAADKPFQLDSVSFTRGSIVVENTDNRDCGPSVPADMKPGNSDAVPVGCDVHKFVTEVAAELELPVHSVGTGQGAGDLPDLGGSHFKLLLRPEIALVARDHVHPYSFGSIWHAIDTHLGIRHSDLDADVDWTSPDLRRYNVLIVPGSIGPWDKGFFESLKPWVESGGTLIAVGTTAYQLAADTSGPSKVRLLRNVLDKLDDYDMAVERDWQAEQKTMPSVAAVFSHGVGSEGPAPFDSSYTRLDKSSLERQDKWRRLFMPEEAPLVAGRTNPEHWLTFGAGSSIAVPYEGSSVLMATSDVESAVRVGVFSPNPQAKKMRVGWSSIPEGNDVIVRQAGLLWPEAVQRMTNAPIVTRESVGKGQIILIGFEPNFRGTTAETRRILFNAMVLGPGFGTEGVVRP